MQKNDEVALAFRSAVESGEAERIRELLEKYGDLRESLDEPWFDFEAPALVYATGQGQRDVVDALIDGGADPNARSNWDAGPYNALHRCVDGATPESLELAEHLIARGATIDLHSAAGLARLDVLAEMLDEAPGRVNEPGPDGATPLHLARNVEVAEFLLDRGAEIDKCCVDHRSTPAMWAVADREDVTRFLVDRGARPDLFMAAVLDDAELAEAILEREPEAITVRVKFGQSHDHLGNGDKYVWALNFAQTPHAVARRRANEAVYRVLLDHSSPSVLLLEAAKRGDLGMMQSVVEVDPDLVGNLDEAGCAELLRGTLEATLWLIERGVDPDCRDEDGCTALHIAAWLGEQDRVVMLLDHGANPSLRDSSYNGSALGWAQEAGHTELVGLLAERCAIDIIDAAWLGNLDRVREIIDADPSMVHGLNEGSISPLRTAAWFGHPEIVRLLLEHGADPNLANPGTGKTALDIATERGHQDVADLLRD